MTIAIYLAHLNPLTNAHAEIIKDLVKNDEVRSEEHTSELQSQD